MATLQHAGVLAALAQCLNATFGRFDLIVVAIGLFGAIVDNVAMVAGVMSMYSAADHQQDSFQWEFMGYRAGTGGSIPIIDSAAGLRRWGSRNSSSGGTPGGSD